MARSVIEVLASSITAVGQTGLTEGDAIFYTIIVTALLGQAKGPPRFSIFLPTAANQTQGLTIAHFIT